MKALKLISALAIASSLAACGGGGETSAKANAKITGPGISGSATVKATINNVDTLNKAKYLNGAESIVVNTTVSVNGSVKAGNDSAAINETVTKDIVLHSEYGGVDPNKVTDYSFSESMYIDGNLYTISGSLNLKTGKLRTDIDSVKGVATKNDFFITNEGTGTNMQLTNDQEQKIESFKNAQKDLLAKAPGYKNYVDEIEAAHMSGWTGIGVDIIVENKGDGKYGSAYQVNLADTLAPNADVFTWKNANVNYAELRKANKGWLTIGENKAIDLVIDNDQGRGNSTNTWIAGGTALVWNKYDTLTATQIVDIVNGTASDGEFNLKGALSPVGSLK